MQELIKDKYFRVELDLDASSPNPEKAIWKGQHTCVSESYVFDAKVPDNDRCSEIIIKHQLSGDKGHYSVLRKAFVSLSVAGFPHSVVSQITRHQDSSFLVQSGRYTGDRFLKVANDELMVEEVFYFRPIGIYKDRKGNKFEYTKYDRIDDISICYQACNRYRQRVNDGCPYEMTRDLIPYNFRQNFEISGDLQAVWHWLDQRSKADSQIEIQSFTAMASDKLMEWCPSLMQWYKDNRYGKARLAP
jgi:thymidylate synthase (FAD)